MGVHRPRLKARSTPPLNSDEEVETVKDLIDSYIYWVFFKAFCFCIGVKLIISTHLIWWDESILVKVIHVIKEYELCLCIMRHVFQYLCYSAFTGSL